MEVFGFGATDAKADLAPVMFERRDPRAGEVAIKITHCGVCHSDLHQVRDDWGNTIYPCVPGHEVVGEVRAVGDGVEAFSIGDRVAVGCMVNSCQDCTPCNEGNEQYCAGPKSCTLTYNGPKVPDGSNSYGGYTTDIVTREEFVLRIPDAIKSAAAGPIVCAGITVYSPMKQWNLQRGQRLGVVGIGGLGHMAIKIGKALGAEVIAITRNAEKVEEIRAMGADEVIISTDNDDMHRHAMSLDMMINTIPVPFDPSPYIALMRPNSALIVVGNMMEFPAFSPAPLIFHRITLAGSLIGGIKETQEVLDICAEHDISPSIKLINIKDVNGVYETLANGNDGDYRHVIDMASLRAHDAVTGRSAERIPDPDRGAVT